MTPRARVAAATASLLTATTLVVATGAPARADVVRDGSSPERAAASCWEVKKTAPDKPSGQFWLVTPQLQTPTRFHCDQSTDGGGWVLVARGRDSWREGGDGRGTPASVAAHVDSPDGFYAKQLPSKTIDALLGGGRVDALADGIRLKRSTNQAGTTSQEVRIKLKSRDRWTWAFAADPGIPVASYSVDGTATTKAQTTRSLTIGSDLQRTFTAKSSATDYVRGFLFGKTGPAGTASSSSHLYSTVSGGRYAAPFTQVWLRPKLLTSSLTYPTIPDGGTAAQAAPAIPESGALPQPWGVTGLGKGGSNYYATEVSAFSQIGNRVYVGGNFTTVRRSDGSAQHDQSYLAAFDATTGEWISSFRPRLDNQVKALAALPNGKLAVGGEFTKLNGKTATALVVIDPATGERHSGFSATLTQSTKGAKRWVRALDVSGSQLYVGGGFTKYKGGGSKTYAFSNILRVNASTGAPSTAWRPNLGTGVKLANGKRSVSSSVLSLDVSDDGSMVYAAGQFQQGYVGDDGKKSVSRPGAAAIRTTSKATFQSWPVKYSTTAKRSQYQQTVKQVGSRVWLGGSQHSFFSYTSAKLALDATHLTLEGGDLQATSARDGVVLGSCHCNDWVFSGTAHFDKPRASGYQQVARIGYVGAWDAATGEYLPEFAPTSTMRNGEGPWALMTAADGTLWAGGDYQRVVGRDGSSQVAQGFTRFAMRPHTPPAAPRDLAASLSGSTATLSWDPSPTDDVSYEILRNDRVVGVTAEGATTAAVKDSTPDDRWFVRASDGNGNRSASTDAVTADTTPTTTTLIGSTAYWAYWFSTASPASDWKTSTDDAGWTYGQAPLGFGTSGLRTTLSPPSGTLRAYFRRSLDIDDVSDYAKVEVSTRADDGAVVMVNGTEVRRKRVSAGVVPADSAVSTSAAEAERWTFEIPLDLLQDGRNRIAVDVRMRNADTADLTHQLTVVGTLR